MVPDASEEVRLKRRYVLGFGLVAAAVLVAGSMPAFAARGHRSAHQRGPDFSVTWVNGPTAPFDATRFDGAVVGTKVYFLGFRTDNDATDGSVWYFDMTTSTYTDTGVDMPIPISNYSPIVLTDAHGQGLYTFGGRDATGQIIKATQVYYPADNMAKIVTTDPYPGTTPAACIALPAMGAIGLGNKAYVLGGMSFSTSVPPCVDDQSAQTWIFDPMRAAGARWQQGPDLNHARGYITPTVSNGFIYAIGGDINSAGTLIAQKTVEAWKPGTAAWNDSAVADLPVACDESQAFTQTASQAAGDIVLATCGQWPNGTGDTLWYDKSANSWSRAGTVLLTVRNEAGAFIKVAGGQQRMYILGGYDSTNSFTTPTNVSEIGKPGALRGDAARHGRAVASAAHVPTN
jgi:hypothetical protein